MSSEESSGTGPHHAADSLRELYHTWRYLFWLLGIAGLVLLIYAEENWRGYSAWESYKKRMIARGEVFSAAAFVPPTVPDDQNFAMTPALVPLFDFLPGTQKWRNSNAQAALQDLNAQYDDAAKLVKPKYSPGFNSWVRARTDLGLWAAAFAQPIQTKRRPHEPLAAPNISSQEAAAKVLDGLSDFTPLLDELRNASSRPYSRFNLRYEEDNPATILLPHLAKIKYLCQVLQLRISAHLALAHSSDALRDLDLLFYLADSSRNEPILISQIVRMAELQLALQPISEGMGLWSEPQLRQIQDRLGHVDFCADLARSLQAERVLFGGGMIEYVRRSHHKISVMDELAAASSAGSSDDAWPFGALFAVSPGGWLYLEQLNYSRTFDHYLIPVIDEKNHQIKPDVALAADGEITKITETPLTKRFFHHEAFSGLLLPSLSKSALKAAFAQSGVEMAAVACALERYRILHQKFPDSLDKLTPDLIAALPHDIINGKGLVYRLEADGHYVLYSVGWNQKDDGGRIGLNKNDEPDQKQGDWVWSDVF